MAIRLDLRDGIGQRHGVFRRARPTGLGTKTVYPPPNGPVLAMETSSGPVESVSIKPKSPPYMMFFAREHTGDGPPGIRKGKRPVVHHIQDHI